MGVPKTFIEVAFSVRESHAISCYDIIITSLLCSTLHLSNGRHTGKEVFFKIVSGG